MAVATITVSSNSPFLKGQEISELNCGAFNYKKKNVSLISDLASKKWMSQKTIIP